MNAKYDILIVGVGGQGTLLASRVLGKYALDMGFDVKLSEVHGMAQRGGSVMTYVRIGKNIASPIIDEGGADLILSFEKLEALRYRHYLKEGGHILYSTQEIMPMPVVTGAAEYPKGIEKELPGTGVDAQIGELRHARGAVQKIGLRPRKIRGGAHFLHSAKDHRNEQKGVRARLRSRVKNAVSL